MIVRTLSVPSGYYFLLLFPLPSSSLNMEAGPSLVSDKIWSSLVLFLCGPSLEAEDNDFISHNEGRQSHHDGEDEHSHEIR